MLTSALWRAHEEHLPVKHFAPVAERETGNADDAAAWRYRRMLDGSGKLAQDGLSNALKQRDSLMRLSALKPRANPFKWVSLGPTNVSGRVRSILIDPNDHSKMLEGTEGGGIWLSTGFGAMSRPVNDEMASLSIGCLARDPNNANVIYAGTGEGYFNEGSIAGIGLFKSTDDGVHWSLQPNTGQFRLIDNVVVQPGNSQRVLMAADGGFFISNDGGANFTNTHAAEQGTSVLYDPKNPNFAIAVAREFDVTGIPGHWAAYFSTNGGQSWTHANGSFGDRDGLANQMQIAYSPSNPNIVYGTNASDNRIWRSIDSGQSYAPVTTKGNTDITQGIYASGVWVDPDNPNTVVVGGLNCWRSTDGGQSVQLISSMVALGQEPHSDFHNIVNDPSFNNASNRIVYVSTDGGVFVTNDILNANPTNGWSLFDHAVSTQYYGAVGDWNSGRIVGGLQDNFTLNTSVQDSNATVMHGGDGFLVAMDPTDSLIQYGEYISLDLFRTMDGGQTVQDISTPDSGGKNANFVSPFELDPNDPNKMWAGGRQVWLSTNVKSARPTWESVGPGNGVLITLVTAAPGNSNVVWEADNDNRIFSTNNALSAAPTWAPVQNFTSGQNQFNRAITCIYFDPSNPKHVFVGLGGFTRNNLWVTFNGGETWSPSTGSGGFTLPDAPVNTMTRDPFNPNNLFVGTGVGVFWSQDGGQTWQTANIPPSSAEVTQVSFLQHSRTLLVATYGRGLFMALFPPVALTASPRAITGGSFATGQVTLGNPALNLGQLVNLSSSSPSVASVPANITIPSAQIAGTFNISSQPVSIVTNVTITAVGNFGTGTATLAVLPPQVTGLTFSANPVLGGFTFQCNVKLSAPAGPAGAAIAFTSGSRAVTAPANATVPAGSAAGTFNAFASPVLNAINVPIKAQGPSGLPFQATLTLQPPTPVLVQLSQPSVQGSSQIVVNFTVFFSGPAPFGLPLQFSSSNPAVASVPASVTVAAGALSATIPVQHFKVSSNKVVTLRAEAEGLTKSITLTVTP